ncbi:unnamed protein product [Moneuplotes crassus]|uniref:RING-type domain-containing protein n=1 Tax=Euplotes crassus TaxID=5936 RepID=A0AAD1X3Y4_EUPCR|nr:unnamed protein product [Moneuplotes crassus]
MLTLYSLGQSMGYLWLVAKGMNWTIWVYGVTSFLFFCYSVWCERPYGEGKFLLVETGLTIMTYLTGLLVLKFEPFLLNTLFFDLKLFFISTNIWWLVAVANFVFGKRFLMEGDWYLILPGIMILSRTTLLSPSFYYPSLSMIQAFYVFASHYVGLFVVSMQETRGSRFFLPRHMRLTNYDLMIHTYAKSSSKDLVPDCSICLNPLDRPELEYKSSWADNCKSYPDGTYILVPCEHMYHPNCLLKRLSQKNERCIICQRWLVKETFED